MPPGGGGGGAWLGGKVTKTTKNYTKPARARRTTWVAGDRPIESLDAASRKNLAAGGPGQEATGTSIFDPVLCELAYRWFCPKGGRVMDPFAGGSVRGIVAATLGLQYTGIELRAEQIAANEAQAKTILKDNRPRWINGDSCNAAKLAPGEYDLVFSCPPYANLEVYSDDPRDISNMQIRRLRKGVPRHHRRRHWNA